MWIAFYKSIPFLCVSQNVIACGCIVSIPIWLILVFRRPNCICSVGICFGNDAISSRVEWFTFLIQQCANIGPADYNYDETISTLRYANRAKNIKNKARINEDPKDALLRQFQKEIEELKRKLEEGNFSQSLLQLRLLLTTAFTSKTTCQAIASNIDI